MDVGFICVECIRISRTPGIMIPFFYRLTTKANLEETSSKLQIAESEKSCIAEQLKTEKAKLVQSQEALQKSSNEAEELKQKVKSYNEEKEKLQTQGLQLTKLLIGFYASVMLCWPIFGSPVHFVSFD